jgi:hypothetical protein
MPQFRALILGFAACLLIGCSQEPPKPRIYEDPKTGVRFFPASGWVVTEVTEPGALFAVEATKGPNLRFLISVSPPRQDILFTQNTFVSCENVKQYIQESLKGVQPICRRGGTGQVFGYDTLYARLLQSEGKVRVQFVNHLFMPVKGMLVQVMAYSIGDDDKAAQALFAENRSAFFAMMGSVRLR